MTIANDNPVGAAETAWARGDVAAAEVAWRSVLADDPGNDRALAGLADIALLATRPDVAHWLAKRVIASQPATPRAMTLIAKAMIASGRHDAAERWALRFTRIDPTDPWPWLVIGTFARARGDQAAINLLRTALALAPAETEAWFHLGVVHRDRSDDLAQSFLGRATTLSPGHVQAHWLRAEPLLRLGKWRDGFADYEWRFAATSDIALPDLGLPLWRDEDLAHRRLLVFGEQGFGDTVMLCRFLPRLLTLAAAVSVVVQDPLAKLLADNMPGVDVIAFSTIANDRRRLPRADFFCPLASLPHRLGVARPNDANAEPYLRVTPDRQASWRQRLGDDPRPTIAVLWAGNPGHRGDKIRSAGFETLAPLLTRPHLRFLSLQPGADPAKLYRAGIANLAPEINDFDDTAAILSLSDLLISVDTAPVHLAGAMGRPAWVMLGQPADWRWLAHSSQTSWYDSLKLYRQSVAGDWTSVIAALGRDLDARYPISPSP